jgi:cytochrome c oxidase subunit 2
MHLFQRRFAALPFLLVAFALLAHAAAAQEPRPWEVNLQPAFSPVQRDIVWLNWWVFGIITAITLFVGGLLVWVLYRYAEHRNPVPSRVSHHTWLEIAWTVIPVLILVMIAIPSFRLLYFEDRTSDPYMTVKVTGHQWYWEYTYPDQDGLAIESRGIAEDQLKPGQKRMLSVDNPLVVPAQKNIRILTTSADVIHSFFVPSFGVQKYAIPGRLMETWFLVEKPGNYYGECNQICGANHSIMPIEVRAIPEADFQAWVKQTKAQQNAENAIPAPSGAGSGARIAEVRR